MIGLAKMVEDLHDANWRAMVFGKLRPLGRECGYQIARMNYGESREVEMHNWVTGEKATLTLTMIAEGPDRGMVEGKVSE